LNFPDEKDESHAKLIKRRSTKILNQLLLIIGYTHPEKLSYISKIKQGNLNNMISDLAKPSALSKYYEDLIEKASDDLLENADKQIDFLKQEFKSL